MHTNDLGIHFIVGLTGTTLESPERELLSELKPAGIIIFQRNVNTTPKWQDELRGLIASAREAIGRDKIIVSIDHEGGRVHRLNPPITRFPSAVNWRENSKAVGIAMGRELRALGFNLNFAPVLDVLREESNQVIGERAFSSDPIEATNFAMEFLVGMESEGVLGCGKHFPGHGATVADSHLELPICSLTKSDLDDYELIPFREYLKRKPLLIMTAHVLFTKLDSENPCTISWRVVTSLLRHELGYEGAVISDALEMGALQHLTREKIGVTALRAGGDLLLIAQPSTGIPAKIGLEMREAISDNIAPGELSVSQERIRKLIEACAAN